MAYKVIRERKAVVNSEGNIIMRPTFNWSLETEDALEEFEGLDEFRNFLESNQPLLSEMRNDLVKFLKDHESYPHAVCDCGAWQYHYSDIFGDKYELPEQFWPVAELV